MTDESKSKKPKLVEARSRNEIDHEEFEMDADFDGENDDVIITPNPRLSKLLKSLEFDSPGPQMKKSYKSFRLRERQEKCDSSPTKADCTSGGVLDKCDCQDTCCPGCFFPCSKCGSSKCGPVCRVKRDWKYSGEIKVEALPSFDSITGAGHPH